MSTPVSIVKTYFKEKTYRSEKYRAFIRKQPCLICGRKALHHHETLSGKGTGIKGPDDEALPLCKTHHDERHFIGRETFFAKYGYFNESWKNLVLIYQKRYEEIHGQKGRVKK